MPELPDLVLYLESLERRIAGQPLEAVRLASPFLLRTVTPSLDDCRGRRVLRLARLGKRLARESGNTGRHSRRGEESRRCAISSP